MGPTGAASLYTDVKKSGSLNSAQEIGRKFPSPFVGTMENKEGNRRVDTGDWTLSAAKIADVCADPPPGVPRCLCGPHLQVFPNVLVDPTSRCSTSSAPYWAGDSFAWRTDPTEATQMAVMTSQHLQFLEQ